MANVGEIRTQLTADMSQLQETINRAERTLGDYERTVDQQLDKTEGRWRRFGRTVRDSLDGMIKKVGSWQSVVGAAAGVAGLGYFIQRTMEFTRQLEHQSDIASISVKTFQELSFAARELGASEGNIRDALKEFNMRLSEFAQLGSGPAKDAYKSLGITQEEARKQLQDTDKAFMQMLDRLKEMSRARRMNLTDMIFGGQGAEAVITLINRGSDAIRDMRDEANQFGVSLDQETIQKSNEAYQSLVTLKDQIEIGLTHAVAGLAPHLEDVAENMSEWISNNQQFLEQDVPQHISDIVGKVESFVTTVNKIPEPILTMGLGAVLGIPGGPYGMAAGALTAGTLGIVANAEDVSESVEKLREYRNELNSVMERQERLQRAKSEFKFGERMGVWTESREKALQKTKEREAELIKKIQKHEQALRDLNKSQDKSVDKTQKDIDKVQKSTDKTEKTTTAEKIIQSYKDKRKAITMTEEAHAKYLAVQKLSEDATQEEVKRLRKAIDEYYELKDAKEDSAALEQKLKAFDERYREATMTTTELELQQLNKRYEALKNHVSDSEKLQKKYKAIYKDIVGYTPDMSGYKQAVKDVKSGTKSMNRFLFKGKEGMLALAEATDKTTRSAREFSVAWKDVKGMTWMEQLQRGTESGFEKMKRDAMNFAQNAEEVVTGAFNKMSSTLTDFVMTGEMEFDRFARSMIKMITKMIIKWQMWQAIKAASTWWSGGLGSAQGNVFENGKQLSQYAQGGVVDRPTVFPMADGAGMMGESGPEAVMPLERTKNGDLGVKTAESNAPSVEVNVINKTGEDADAKKDQPKWDGQKWVMNIVLDAANRNKSGFGKNLKGALSKV